MTKKDLNELLITLEVFERKQLEADAAINNDSHLTDKLNENEVKIALMAKQTKFLRSIKNILTFFMILTIIGMVMMLFPYL